MSETETLPGLPQAAPAPATARKLETQAAYARRHGVTRAAVSKWAKAGQLVLAPDPANAKRMLVNVAASDALRSRNQDPVRLAAAERPVVETPAETSQPRLQEAADASPVGTTVFQRAKTMHEVSRAKRTDLALKREMGELAPVAEMISLATNAVGFLIRKLTTSRRGLVAQIRAASSEQEARKLLRERDTDVLTGFAKMLNLIDGDVPQDFEEAA